MPILVETPVTKALFLHVPKTGGTFVERVLGEMRIGTWARAPVWVDRRHALAEHVQELYDVRIVTLRRPDDWHRSWCAVSRKTRPPTGVWHPLKSCWWSTASIEEYVDRMPDNFLGTLYEQFMAGEGSLILMRTDRLRNSLRRVLDGMGFDATIVREFPPQNVSKPDPLPEHVAQALIDKEPVAMKLWESAP